MQESQQQEQAGNTCTGGKRVKNKRLRHTELNSRRRIAAAASVAQASVALDNGFTIAFPCIRPALDALDKLLIKHSRALGLV